MESQAYKDKEQLLDIRSFPWKGKDKEYDAILKQRINVAKNLRRQTFRRFDELTYEDDYVANEDAVTAYLRPKKNDDEVRVNTATTEKKVEIIINEILSYNFQPEIHAFDKEEMEINELGDAMEDMVLRTNQLEEDDDVNLDILTEFISQRAVFIEEYLEEREDNGVKIKRCRKRLLSGLQVFLGDPRLPYYRFNEQPYICKYYKMNYWTAKMLYGHLTNFKFVNPGQGLQSDWYGGEFNWRLGRLDNMEVEMIVYESAQNREYQWWLNAVPMEQFGTELPWKHEGYNTVMGIVKRLSPNLSYGRCVTASLKYLQGFKDETVRNLIKKFRQAIDPPKGVAGQGKIYSKDIFESGKITYGISPNTFSNLVDHQGLTQSDVQMLDIIEKIGNEFSSSSAATQGIPEGKKQTATAIIEQRKQAVKMLGLVVFGWTRVLREATRLRIYNLIENFTEPNGKDRDPITNKITDVYHRFTLKNAELSSGDKGNKIIQFTNKNLTPQEEDNLLAHEQEQAKNNKPTEIQYVNGKLLQKLWVNWQIIITPKEKEDSALHKVMFADKLKQAAELGQLIGKQLNGDKWEQEYQLTWKVKDAFAQAQPMMPGQEAQPGQQPSGMGDMGQQMTTGLKASVRKPSVSKLAMA